MSGSLIVNLKIENLFKLYEKIKNSINFNSSFYDNQISVEINKFNEHLFIYELNDEEKDIYKLDYQKNESVYYIDINGSCCLERFISYIKEDIKWSVYEDGDIKFNLLDYNELKNILFIHYPCYKKDV